MKIEGFCGVKFWLNRVAEEKVEKAVKQIHEAQVMNYQVLNIDVMPDTEKNKVVKKLKEEMKRIGWEKSLNDHKEELEEVRER